MDIKWAIEQACDMAITGGCKISAAESILNAIAMSEQDTIDQYNYAKQRLIKLFENENDETLQKCVRILVDMIDRINNDERDHAASANKAASVLKNASVPKATEYDEAVKEVDKK
jgi:hypothetical protein